jgi:chromate transporter
LRFWLKLGFISFGGPAGQIAIMHEELVERRRWISENRFLHALNYCMVLPGPEAQQLATYIGWLLHGVRGGIAAGALFVLPSLLILGALAWLYVLHGDAPLVQAVLSGVKPAVVAIVLAAAWRIGSRALRHPSLWAVALAALLAIRVLDWPFPLVIALAAIAGALIGRLVPHAIASGAHAAARRAAAAPSLIDDDDPPPPHARFRLRRVAAIAAGFGLLWAAALLALTAAFGGWQSTPVQLAWFHTKAALLTFGGAYAVLPYVYQAAVEHYQWLTGPQMIDGLALGETTPGPLIMIVAWVGFLAGWGSPFVGAGLQPAAAWAGAAIATAFTFLPSFLFILAGGPFVEGTRQQLRLQAPLTGITAAVVGVIVSLALFFAAAVLVDAGGAPDLAACAIAFAALLALVAFRRGIIEVIVAAAAIGLLLHLF